MANELEVLKNLKPYYTDLNVIKLTAEQIQKDFAWFGEEIQFSEDTKNAYQDLYDQIEPRIYKMICNDFQKLLSVLYRIDISERQLRNHLASTEEDSSELLTALIIERELKKVLIRKIYSKNY